LDISRGGGQPTRVTFGPNDFWPVWSPDGKQIACGVTENGKTSIRRRSLDGSQPEEVLYQKRRLYRRITRRLVARRKYLSLDLETKDESIRIGFCP